MITGLQRQGPALQGYADIGWLSRLNGRALVVCRIVLPGNQGGATGFLIGKDLIMTNNHVLDSLEMARGAKAHFFYTKDSDGVEVALNPDNFFYTSPTPDLLGFKPITKDRLDFTLVSIHSHPKITTVCHLAFSIFCTTIPKTETHATIIHHPIDPEGTSYQKVSFRENLIKESALFTIHYTTTTLPGSSGAPVIDDEGNLIALHRATCTHILKALLKETMLAALLEELFPGVVFVSQTLMLMEVQSKQEMKFTGLCAPIENSSLYIFSEGELKGQYFYQGKAASLFRLIATKHTPAKEWALQFLNKRLEEPLADYHRECNTAVPIKAIHDHLKSANLLAQVLARYEASQKNLCNLLKESCLRHCSSLPLILTNAAFPIESFFTQLSIVSHSSQEKKEEEARQRDPNLVEKDSLREIYARLCETEKPIEIGTLFDQRENKPIRRVLVLGRAGIGKSTLCQKIAHDWAAGTLFNQKFALVYHIKLRDFNSLKKFHDDWVCKMIAESCYGGAHQEKIHQELQTNPEKILLIFDGWDEASPELIQALETYFLQTQVHYLLTSRPGVTSRVHGNFDLIVENMGFSRPQVETYIEKFFTHTHRPGVDLFLKMLRSRSTLFIIAHIPIQLQILCALWQKGEQDFPQTLTSLFSKITHHLLDWEQNKNLQKEKLTPLKHLFLYQALGEVALKGLESKQLIISSKLVEETLIEKSLENSHFENNIKRQDLINTGLVKECGANNELYFIHLTYQEYSIARYISSLPKCYLDKKQAQEKQCAFVQTYRYKPHFHLVIRMLAGLLWEDSKNIAAMETFFGWLYEGHTDLIGGYQTELVLSCLDECQNVELEKRIWERYKISDFVDFILEREATRKCLGRLMALSTPVFMHVVQHLKKEVGIQQLQLLHWFFMNLNQYSNEERAPEILNLIQRDRYEHRAAAEALGELAAHGGKEHIPQILNLLQAAFRDQDEWVRNTAAETLGRVAAHVGKEYIPQILNEIQTALSHQNSNVRNAAARALGKLAAHAGKENIPQILNLLQAALRDQHGYVRCGVVKALGELTAHAGKEYIPQILNLLQAALSPIEKNFIDGPKWALENQRVLENHVRCAAAEALGELAVHAGTENIPQILNLLQAALSDQAVRSDAARALGELAAHAKKEGIPQILNYLQTALGDRKDYVRSTAATALGKLAAHAGKDDIPKILNAIQTALRDQDSEVRWAATEAFGELAAYVGKDDIPPILNELQKALRDQMNYVRIVAVTALGELAAHGGKDDISPILNELQTALRDQDSDVRSTATRALRKLAAYVGKEYISQILTWIQTTLRDQSEWVRYAAVEALGEIAAYVGKENIPQILIWIQTALRDQSASVCTVAARALGEIAAHVEKENVPQILNGFQTALRNQDWDVSKDAAQTTCGLKTEWLLSAFTSPSFSHSELTPIIFDHFINQSIPLYFMENSGSIHTSDTCFETFDPKQLTLLSQCCTTLLTQTKKEAPM